MNPSWKTIVSRTTDPSIGATLVRLARQAAAMHMHETARRACRDHAEQRDGQPRAEGATR